MSEALDLEWKDVDLRGKQAVVWQKQGNESRRDLVPVLMEALESLPHRHGHVFRPVQIRRRFKGADPERIIGDRYHNNGRTSGGQIKSGWAAACRKAKLPGKFRVWIPKGETTERRVFVPDITPHDLRHTWATWPLLPTQRPPPPERRRRLEHDQYGDAVCEADARYLLK